MPFDSLKCLVGLASSSSSSLFHEGFCISFSIFTLLPSSPSSSHVFFLSLSRRIREKCVCIRRRRKKGFLFSRFSLSSPFYFLALLPLLSSSLSYHHVKTLLRNVSTEQHPLAEKNSLEASLSKYLKDYIFLGKHFSSSSCDLQHQQKWNFSTLSTWEEKRMIDACWR